MYAQAWRHKQGGTDLKARHEDTEIKVIVSKGLGERSRARYVCEEVGKRIGSAAEACGGGGQQGGNTTISHESVRKIFSWSQTTSNAIPEFQSRLTQIYSQSITQIIQVYVTGALLPAAQQTARNEEIRDVGRGGEEFGK